MRMEGGICFVSFRFVYLFDGKASGSVAIMVSACICWG